MTRRRVNAVRYGVALLGAVTFAAVVVLVVHLYEDPTGPDVAIPPIGGSFTLTDHNGNTVTDADFKGSYMLIFFGFTFCPDMCPTALATITNALDILDEDARNLVPVFITIDPERDTPENLKPYVQNFHPRLVGLTGTADQISTAAKAYQVFYAKSGTGDDYLMDHSAVIYLMGPDGKYVTHFTDGTAPDTMAAKIRESLQE